MSLMTIVLSGPAGVVTQARSALQNAGFTIDQNVRADGQKFPNYDWGLQDNDPSHTFITAQGDDIDAANAAVGPLGWRLRSHWPNNADIEVTAAEPSRDDVLLGLQRDVAELRGALEIYRLINKGDLPPDAITAAVENSPAFIQANSYSAEITRRAVNLQYARSTASVPGGVAGGVVNLSIGDLIMSAPVSGMSVNIAAGEALVPGSSTTTQSGYYFRGSSQTNLAVAASNPSNPRIDLVCATVNDAAYTGALNSGILQVVTGTPTASANLSNLNGAPSLPTSSLLIGYVLVPANATNIVSGDLGDHRAQVQLYTGISGQGLPLALTGATAATRYVGATASGAPGSGTFAVGDFVIDQTGKEWICTSAGSPGTWTQIGSSTIANFVTNATLGSGATTSASFAALATQTAAVTVTTNTKALVILTGALTAGSSATCALGVAVSGATTIAVSTGYFLQSTPNGQQQTFSIMIPYGSGGAGLGALTAGSNTFTAEIASGSGGTSVRADSVSVTVIPLN